jgi:trigger factor
MNVEVTRLPESRVALKVELTPQEVEGALDRTYKQLVQRVNIPGFRKGKAPRAVVERMVGAEYFLHEATDEAVRWGYRKAIDSENLTPIDQAEIDTGPDAHEHVETGEPFHFEATVAVKPEVQLPDYSTIRVEREQVEVSDDDVNEVIEDIRERNATLEPVSRPAQIGDVVTINITGRVDGEEVINNDNAEYELRDEENGEPDPTLPGLSAELVGISAGEIREFVLQLPDEYPDENVAGKSLVVRVLGKETKRKVLPELNDDFAQSVSVFQTVDELRDGIRSNIEVERRVEADEKLVTDAVNAVTERTFIDIPPVLIDEEIDRVIDDMRVTFERQRLSLETYLEATQKTEADLRHDMRESATNNVKQSLVLGAIADAENISVSNRELDTALEEALRTMQTTDAERRRLRSSSAVRTNIRNRLRRQRAIQKLVETVTGGEEISTEATEAIADQTAAAAEDTEETVAVEVGG